MNQSEHPESLEMFAKQNLDPQTLQKMSLQLQNILAMRGDLSLKVAKRATFLTRFVMLVFGVIAISFLLFMIIMATRIEVLTGTVTTMNQVFTNMTADMVIMRKHVETMEARVGSMPGMQKNLVSMDGTMTQMNTRMKHIAIDMKTIRQDLDDMNQSVNKMDGSFTHMQNSMLKLESDVNRVSSPMRTFNKMVGR